MSTRGCTAAAPFFLQQCCRVAQSARQSPRSPTPPVFVALFVCLFFFFFFWFFPFPAVIIVTILLRSLDSGAGQFHLTLFFCGRNRLRFGPPLRLLVLVVFGHSFVRHAVSVFRSRYCSRRRPKALICLFGFFFRK